MALTGLQDDNRNPIGHVPSSLAIDETYDATISTSTALSLNASTKLIEVTAIDKGIFYKWGGTVSSTDFDGFVAPNTSKLIPRVAGQTSIEFIEESATAKLVVVEY